MSKVKDITVGVKLTVDESMAETALKLCEIYVNEYGLLIQGERQDNGEYKLRYISTQRREVYVKKGSNE